MSCSQDIFQKNSEYELHHRNNIDIIEKEKPSLQQSALYETNVAATIKPMLQNSLNKFRSNVNKDIIKHFDICINETVDQLMNEIDSSALLLNSQWQYNKMRDKTRPSDLSQGLPEKEFCNRNSVLTDLFKVSHMLCLYQMFVAALIVFSISKLLIDVYEKNSYIQMFYLDLIMSAFGGLQLVTLCWVSMFTSTSIFVYSVFGIWFLRRPTSTKVTIFDMLFLIVYIFYQFAFTFIVGVYIRRNDLPPASSAILSIECLRMLMKSHAFVRVNVEKLVKAQSQKSSLTARVDIKNLMLVDKFFIGLFKIMSLKLENNHEIISRFGFPTFTHYIYFLFAPTLIYRDVYPRSKIIRWKFVASNFLQFAVCFILGCSIYSHYCFHYFDDFVKMQSIRLSIKQLLLITSHFILPANLIIILGFYSFLHCWHNAFAELLRFGDRLFYKDWWVNISIRNFPRTWNVIVHDWLYTYIYRDLHIMFNYQCLLVAQISVFLFSAIIHEYVLIVVFRLFYPIQFFGLFVSGFTLKILNISFRRWNIIIFIFVIISNALVSSQYYMEWYARKICHDISPQFTNYFIPRLWICRR